MALFDNYMKEGPGVDKNEKKKRGIFLYSDVVTRKFFQLMKLNILYVIFSLPHTYAMRLAYHRCFQMWRTHRLQSYPFMQCLPLQC